MTHNQVVKVHKYKIGSHNERKAMKNVKREKYLTFNPFAMRYWQPFQFNPSPYMPLEGSACCYLAAVIEYLVADLLELTADVVRREKAKIITPRHIMIAMKEDDEFNEFMQRGGVIIPWAGVPENIHPFVIKHDQMQMNKKQLKQTKKKKTNKKQTKKKKTKKKKMNKKKRDGRS